MYVWSSFADEVMLQIKRERDQYAGQVDFLNSVIVDMQQKKAELQNTIEVLKKGNVPDDAKAYL